MQRDDGAQPPPGAPGPFGGDLSDPLVGRILDGRYRIGTRIARGGMASVYQASDLRLDRTVAVKIMHAGLGDDHEFAARFVREAKAAAAISHPNVVAVYDQGDDNGVVFLAMELITGHTLRDVIRNDAPLSPARSMAFFEPVVAALAAAHRAGLIHRDIKPENVLIADDGRIKVADFGLAKAVSADTQHTATGGVLIGTVSYLAPELVVDGRADARADVYAAGVMLYEMLTGKKPHDGESPIQVAYKHVHADVPAPSALVSRIPAYVDALVARATSRDRSLRPADATVLLHQVRRVGQALAEGVVDDPELVADLMPATIPEPAELGAAEDIEDTIAEPVRPVAAAGVGFGVPVVDAAVEDAEGNTQPRSVPVVDEELVEDWHEMDEAGDVPAQGQAFDQPSYDQDRPYDQESDRRFDIDAVADEDLAAAFAPSAAAAVAGAVDLAAAPQPGSMAVGPAVEPPRGRTAHSGPQDGPAAWGASSYHEATAAIPGLRAPDETRPPAGGRGRPPKAPKPPKPPRQRRSLRGPLLVLLSVLLIAGAATGAWWYGIGRYTTTPGLLGLTQAQAEAKLAEAGLDVEVADPQYSEEVAKGEIIQTDPPPGTKILRSGSVTITVSLGKERYKVPDVVGKTEDKAQDLIAARNLAFGESKRVFSETVEKGRVISSDPKAGVKLKRDSVVNLVVSKGRQPIRFTDWTGKSADAAKKALEAKGLVVDISNEEYSDTVPAGYVITQDPATGPLYKGDKITLIVSKGPEMIQIPKQGVIAAGVDAARATLEGLGFVVKVEQAPDYLGLGFVKNTDPPAGSSVPKGSTITLFVI
ncbi:MAG: serine/threonine protein kinase [Nocardioidaceae bacterium]|nr:serine/threonine protein kinase [Nocardioidaceae bacterium]